MKTKLIDRKYYRNNNGDLRAVAFIELFNDDKVQVFSNLCDGFSNMRIRETGKITCDPHSLLNEIQLMQSLETPKSPQLQQWCATVWEEAKRTDQWFEKF